MFIIFGWGRKAIKDYGPTLPIKCGNCNNKVFSRFVRVRVWFTLFFIPVIPYETKYFLLCETCSHGNELFGKDIENAKKLNAVTISYLNHEITEEKYQLLLKSPDVLTESSNPNDSWECPNCSKENANTDYRCKNCNYSIL